MIPLITITNKAPEPGHLAIIISKIAKLPAGMFNTAEQKYLKDQIETLKQDVVSFNRYSHWLYIYIVREEKDQSKQLETARKAGDQIAGFLNTQKARRIAVFDAQEEEHLLLAFTEGMALGSYQFLKYKKDKEKENTLQEIEIYSGSLEGTGTEKSSASPVVRLTQLNILLKAVCFCRDLINEPNSYLTATVFSKEAERMAKESGVHVEVLNKQQLTDLKMNGLLGVNQGSHEPPTFTIMEWNPADAINNKPIVFIGKGVMYDTGGMNLKPGDSMMNMKDDMSGAAAVATAVYAIAKAKLRVHVVA